MKKKLSLQDFAEYLAARKDLSRKDADTFVRTFFDLIEQGLSEDKFVKIKGFGTFKLVAVSERESVNINTGERFQISGHTKVSFTPDVAMKELVNRPFAHFASVYLDEETSVSELDEIDRENAEAFAEQPESITAVEGTHPEEETQVDSETATKEDTPATPIEDASTDTEEVIPLTDDSETEEMIPETEGPNAVLPTEEAKPAEECTPMPETSSEETTPSAEPANTETTPTPTEAALPSPASTLTIGIADTPDTPHKKRNPWKVATFILAVILLMSASYFAGYFRILCPCSYPVVEKWLFPAETPVPTNPQPKPIPQHTQTAQPITKDTIKQNEKPTPRATVDTTPPQKETPKTEKPQTHLVKPGDNVYKISRRYYGTDDYVEAIIRLNKLGNADNIVIGSTLKLP